MAATDRHRHQGIYETVKQHLAYQKGLAPAIGSLNKIIGLTFGQSDFYLYLCTLKRASTGGASAIQVNLIALGLHRPCAQISQLKIIR